MTAAQTTSTRTGGKTPATTADTSSATALATPVKVDAVHDAANSPVANDDNKVRQAVESIVRIQADMHEIRENLVADGVPNQTISVLVEMGARNKLSDQESLIEAALAASSSELGVGAISRESLMQQINAMVNLEKDTGEAKRLAKSQGMALPALNALIGFVRQNPGDGGTRMVRLFVTYALACDISLDGVGRLHDELTAPKASVLPVIERRPAPDWRASRQLLIREALVGLMIGVGVMWLVV